MSATDIGVFILTAWRAVAAIGHQHEVPVAWLIEIIVVPGIFRQRAAQVRTIPGVATSVVFHQSFQRFRITADVEAIGIERRLQVTDLRSRGGLLTLAE